MGKRIMLVASFGGHLSEILELEDFFTKYDYIIVTSKAGYTKTLSPKYNFYYLLEMVDRERVVAYLFKHLCNTFLSAVILIKHNPPVIISTGAKTAVPMCLMGKLLKKKIVYIETYSAVNKPTATGKLLYPISDLFIIQWRNLLKFYPKAKYYGGGLF